MKLNYLSYTFFFLLISFSTQAQIQLQNGGFESWTTSRISSPENWTPLEQSMGVTKSHWVSRETTPGNIHSGLNAIRLYSDTISMRSGLPSGYADSPSQVLLWPGMLAYGRARYVNHKMESSGVPIYGRPTSFSMYVKVYHPITDTARLRLLLTRWNSYTKRQDTLAYERKDIFPDSTDMSSFAYYIDSINYLMDGQADTMRLIISGGKRGDINLQGNTVWIDDLTLNYPNAAMVHTHIEDEVVLSPNPATTKIYIQSSSDLAGYSVIFVDVTGLTIKDVTLSEGATTIDVGDMHEGSYTYAILDRDKNKLHDGNINIMKDR